MATTNIDITTAWTLLATGPTTAAGTVSAHVNSAELAIATSTPASSLHGMTTYQSDPYEFTLASGENLYGRAASPSDAAKIILNT